MIDTVTKVNLGAGNTEIPGFKAMDAKRGDSIYPLSLEGLDEIRASHCLEHFPQAEVQAILNNWVAALMPGGVLKIAVPDFQVIAQQYLAGTVMPVQSVIMGGQVDELDYHKVIFDEPTLALMLRTAGLVSVRRWVSEIEDCAALPISLNLAGNKPADIPLTAGVISMPRLGFNDFWACAFQELNSAGVSLRKSTGAYWDRDLTRGIEEALADQNPEYILTADYDTIFNRHQVRDLLDLAHRYPHADAIAPLQTARHHNRPMFTAVGPDGKVIQQATREDLTHGEILKARTAHFGLTLFKADKLRALPKPWMKRVYTNDGSHDGEGAMDPDIYFWQNWADAGNTLYIALRVPVGHCDLMIRWPNNDLEASYQHTSDYRKSGVPGDLWR